MRFPAPPKPPRTGRIRAQPARGRPQEPAALAILPPIPDGKGNSEQVQASLERNAQTRAGLTELRRGASPDARKYGLFSR